MGTPVSRLIALAALATFACAGAPPAKEPSIEAAASAPPTATPTGQHHPLSIDDMLSFERISGPAVSPDGKLVAFTVGTPDLEANKQAKDVWLAATDGSFVRRLTSHPQADSDPRFSPDGRSLILPVVAGRIDAGVADRGRRRRGDAGDEPPGRRRARSSRSPTASASSSRSTSTRTRRRSRRARSARTRRRPRSRRCAPSISSRCATGTPGTTGRGRTCSCSRDEAHEPVDLLKGLPYDAPTKPFGDLNEVAISKDGSEVVFTSKMVGREDAWSTNSDLWVVPADGSAKPRSLTSGEPRDRHRAGLLARRHEARVPRDGATGLRVGPAARRGARLEDEEVGDADRSVGPVAARDRVVEG